jgi:hypothetical protein
VTVTKTGFGVSIGVELLLEGNIDVVGAVIDVDEGTDGLGVDIDSTDDDVDVGVDDDDDFNALLELQLDVGAGAG